MSDRIENRFNSSDRQKLIFYRDELERKLRNSDINFKIVEPHYVNDYKI